MALLAAVQQLGSHELNLYSTYESYCRRVCTAFQEYFHPLHYQLTPRLKGGGWGAARSTVPYSKYCTQFQMCFVHY